jgi:hypothetical protein
MRLPDLTDIVAVPIFTIVFYIVCVFRAKAVRQGKPLTDIQKQMLAYATLFVFGMGYIIVLKKPLGDALHWEGAWKWTIAVWCLLLSLVAWARNRSAGVSG